MSGLKKRGTPGNVKGIRPKKENTPLGVCEEGDEDTFVFLLLRRWRIFCPLTEGIRGRRIQAFQLFFFSSLIKQKKTKWGSETKNTKTRENKKKRNELKQN